MKPYGPKSSVRPRMLILSVFSTPAPPRHHLAASHHARQLTTTGAGAAYSMAPACSDPAQCNARLAAGGRAPWQKPTHCQAATSAAVRRTTSRKNSRYRSSLSLAACRAWRSIRPLPCDHGSRTNMQAPRAWRSTRPLSHDHGLRANMQAPPLSTNRDMARRAHVVVQLYDIHTLEGWQ